MRSKSIETLVWVLIYGGLLVLVLGLALARSGARLGGAMVVAGGVVAAAGVVLIWIRSKMKE